MSSYDVLTPEGAPVAVGSTNSTYYFASVVSANGDLLLTRGDGNGPTDSMVTIQDSTGGLLNEVSRPQNYAFLTEAAALSDGNFVIPEMHAVSGQPFQYTLDIVSPAGPSGGTVASTAFNVGGSVWIAPLANGGFVAEGSQYGPGPDPQGSSVVQTFDANGSPTSQFMTVSGTSPNGGPLVAYGTGGAFVAAPEEVNSQASTSWGEIENFNGSGFEPGVRISFLAYAGAELTNGDIVFVGPQNGTVEAQVYDPATNALVGGPVVIDQSPLNSVGAPVDSAPNVVATPDGGYVVSWSTGDANGYDEARAVGPSGDMGPTFALSGQLAGAKADGEIVTVRLDSQEHYWEQTYQPTSSSATAPGRTLTAPNDSGTTLTGGAGNDTLIASHGADVLTGGAGADTFEFPVIPWSAGHVTDFTPGTDVIDLAPLLQAAHYGGSNPVADGWVSFSGDGHGDTLVWFAPHDGSNHGYPYLITTLDHVAPSSLVLSHDLMFT